MSVVTAQILIGNSHPNDGGINPIHKIELSEGSRPAWTLTGAGCVGGARGQSIVWIPSVENILEDALLMAAIHAFKCDSIINQFHEFVGEETRRMEVNRCLSREQLALLHEQCRQLRDFPKIILMSFCNSAVHAHINRLSAYRMDCEVLVPIYTRSYSRWSNSQEVSGSI